MLLSSSLAFSQETDQTEKPKWEISVNGGIASPYIPEEFNNQSNRGVHYGAGFGSIFDPGSIGYSSLYVTLGYDYFKANTGELMKANKLTGTNWALTGGTTGIMTVQFEYKGTFSASRTTLAPFFLLGIGAEHFQQKDVTFTDPTDTVNMSGEHRTMFAWNLGVGFDMPIGPYATLYNEVRYFLGVGDIQTQHLTASAGVRVRF